MVLLLWAACITENLFVLFQFVPHSLDVLRVERGQVVHSSLQIRNPYLILRIDSMILVIVFYWRQNFYLKAFKNGHAFVDCWMPLFFFVLPFIERGQFGSQLFRYQSYRPKKMIRNYSIAVGCFQIGGTSSGVCSNISSSTNYGVQFKIKSCSDSSVCGLWNSICRWACVCLTKSQSPIIRVSSCRWERNLCRGLTYGKVVPLL